MLIDLQQSSGHKNNIGNHIREFLPIEVSVSNTAWIIGLADILIHTVQSF